jgi:hypothetical protein
MDNQKDPRLSPEDELKAENNLLKLKLGLEHGMQMHESGTLSPDIENEWLKSVYAFEQQYKNAKKIKVYDRIGRPPVRKWDTLTSNEISEELRRLHVLMENKGLALDVICKYDDIVIYRFITEELLDHEMDDMNIPGMMYHFVYEEFHPNHDHDLRRHTGDFIKAVFKRQWDEEFDVISLASSPLFSGKEYNRKGISSIIKAFQEAHDSRRIKKFRITSVVYAPELTNAEVQADLCWIGKMKTSHNVRHEGKCILRFVREYDYWSVREFFIPGFTEPGV